MDLCFGMRLYNHTVGESCYEKVCMDELSVVRSECLTFRCGIREIDCAFDSFVIGCMRRCRMLVLGFWRDGHCIPFGVR